MNTLISLPVYVVCVCERIVRASKICTPYKISTHNTNIVNEYLHIFK